MSRTIQAKQSITISEQEKTRNNTASGKLLITEMYHQKVAFLICENRLTSVSFLDASKVGTIFLGKIKNIVPNIDACFIETVEKEICFLPMKELSGLFPRNRVFDGRWKEGDELAVQITRDAQKTKQASVTGHIELTSQYVSFVLGEEGFYFSKKLTLTEQDQINNILSENISLPCNANNSATKYSCIIRTAAKELLISEKKESVLQELKNSFDEWQQILIKLQYQVCFSLISGPKNQYKNMIEKFIRPSEYSEIVTDNSNVYEALKTEMQDSIVPIRLYQDSMLSLNQLYGLQSKLDMALGERIWLKSGAYLVIEPTEALTVIDVNSGKYEAKRANNADYLLTVNLEAAEEIAVQLRLRNLSGIIIVDFINMEREEDKQTLLQYLKQQTAKDVLPTKVVDITELGLVEITRKKIEKTLKEQVALVKTRK